MLKFPASTKEFITTAALVLFVLAPALILFTINLPDLGSFALILWLVYLMVLIVEIGRP